MNASLSLSLLFFVFLSITNAVMMRETPSDSHSQPSDGAIDKYLWFRAKPSDNAIDANQIYEEVDNAVECITVSGLAKLNNELSTAKCPNDYQIISCGISGTQTILGSWIENDVCYAAANNNVYSATAKARCCKFPQYIHCYTKNSEIGSSAASVTCDDGYIVTGCSAFSKSGRGDIRGSYIGKDWSANSCSNSNTCNAVGMDEQSKVFASAQCCLKQSNRPKCSGGYTLECNTKTVLGVRVIGNCNGDSNLFMANCAEKTNLNQPLDVLDASFINDNNECYIQQHNFIQLYGQENCCRYIPNETPPTPPTPPKSAVVERFGIKVAVAQHAEHVRPDLTVTLYLNGNYYQCTPDLSKQGSIGYCIGQQSLKQQCSFDDSNNNNEGWFEIDNPTGDHLIIDGFVIETKDGKVYSYKDFCYGPGIRFHPKLGRFNREIKPVNPLCKTRREFPRVFLERSFQPITKYNLLAFNTNAVTPVNVGVLRTRFNVNAIKCPNNDNDNDNDNNNWDDMILLNEDYDAFDNINNNNNDLMVLAKTYTFPLMIVGLIIAVLGYYFYRACNHSKQKNNEYVPLMNVM